MHCRLLVGSLSPDVVDFRAGVVSALSLWRMQRVVSHVKTLMRTMRRNLRKFGREFAELCFPLVVHHKHSELGALCLAFGLRKLEKLLLDVVLQLRHRVPARHETRSRAKISLGGDRYALECLAGVVDLVLCKNKHSCA